MKLKLKILVFALFTIIVPMIGCVKDPVSDHQSSGAAIPSSSTTADTLQGKEFIFSDLTWAYWLDDSNEVYTSIENRPDLFYNDRVAELYVKCVTDTAWIPGQKDFTPGDVYGLFMKSLYVLPCPYMYPPSQLVGSKVSLKIKFF